MDENYISFKYRPDNSDVIVYDLISCKITQEHYGLNRSIWANGIYTPAGILKIDLASYWENEYTEKEMIQNFLSVFDSFSRFKNWCLKQPNIINYKE
jgi:hypothetical protein